MAVTVRTRIVRIGNSQGIRIPKVLLEQVNLAENNEVELEVQSEQIIIRPTEARHGWSDAFKAMAERGDDAMLDEQVNSTTTWDEEAWEW